MANIKQQKKRILTDNRDRLANHSFLSKTRTALKKANKMIEDNAVDRADYIAYAFGLLDKLVKKKIKKPNFVNRNKARLMKKNNNKDKTLIAEKK